MSVSFLSQDLGSTVAAVDKMKSEDQLSGPTTWNTDGFVQVVKETVKIIYVELTGVSFGMGVRNL